MTNAEQNSIANVLLVDVPVGRGNRRATEAMHTVLAKDNIPVSTVTLEGPLVYAAGKFHQHMRGSVERGLSYSSSNIRTSLPAHLLGFDAARQIIEAIPDPSQPFVILTAQDIVARSTEQMVHDEGLPGSVVCVSPDVFCKQGAWMPAEGAPSIGVWSREAQERIGHHLPTTKIHLTEPLPLAHANTRGTPINGHDSHPIIIKCSGSGADAEFVAELARTASQSTDVYIYPGTATVKRQALAEAPLAQIIDDDTYYKALREHGASIAGLIVPPSEQIATMAALSAKGYPIPPLSLLPPGGDHEGHNAVYAISIGMTRTIIAPQHLQPTIERNLKERGLTKDIMFHTTDSFMHGFHPSEQSWERPSDAKPLTAIVQELLS